MNKKIEAVDLDESAELSFGERQGSGKLAAMEMMTFDRLSLALIYAVEKLDEKYRSRCMVTTRSGSVYHWDAIQELYQHVRIARGR